LTLYHRALLFFLLFWSKRSSHVIRSEDLCRLTATIYITKAQHLLYYFPLDTGHIYCKLCKLPYFWHIF
jgi:hypothetical protein